MGPLSEPVAATAPESEEVAPSSESPFDTDELLGMSLEDLLQLSVEAGSLVGVRVEEIPASITLINARDIAASGARTLGELLEIYVPDFQMVANKWVGTLWGMRGVAPDRNTKIIFLVNGLKMNEESRDGAYSEIDLGLLGDIERVEVLAGPSGLAYGSGAIAGVVNVQTKEPNRPGGKAAFGLGAWLDPTFEADVNTEIDGHWLTLAAGYRSSPGAGLRRGRVWGANQWPTDGQPSPRGEPTDGSPGDVPGNLRASADWRWEKLRFYGRFTREQISTGQYYIVDPWPEYGGLPPDDAPPKRIDGRLVGPNDPLANTDSAGASRQLHVVDGLTLSGSYEHDLGPDLLSANLAFFGVSNRVQIQYRKNYSLPGTSTPDPYRAGEVQSAVGERRYLGRLAYQLRRFSTLRSALGLEYRLDDIGPDLSGLNFHGANEKVPEVTPVTYHNFAAFTETFWEAHPLLTLEAGLRLDKHTRTAFLLNPKAAVLFKPAKGHVIKAVAQTSSNNATASVYEPSWQDYNSNGELLHDDQEIEVVPEKATSFELASIHQIDGLRIEPSVSYTHFSNLFAWNQRLFTIVNAGTYNGLAMTLAAHYQRDWLQVGVSHAYQRPINTSLTPTVLDSSGGAIEVNGVTDQVTLNGRSYLNLATHVSKAHVSVSPWPWLSLSSSVRVFWALDGRKKPYDTDHLAGENYLSVQSKPIVKWNVGARAQLPSNLWAGIYGYDLLGTPRSRNAVRWQQWATAEQREVYTTDLRSVVVRVGKDF